MNDEHQRHHYIPRFILRSFCYDGKDRIWYFDKSTSEISSRFIKDVFMKMDLYRSDVNSPDDPMEVEKDLAQYESEVAQIVRDKLLQKGNSIHLTYAEKASIELFLSLLWFRSVNCLDRIQEEKPNSFIERIIRKFNKESARVDQWRQCIGIIAKCRSLEEVLQHPDIPEGIKQQFAFDILGPEGMYMVVAERRGSEDFLIADEYPMAQNLNTNIGDYPIYSFYPLSPERMLILVYRNPFESKQRLPIDFRLFDDDMLKPPKSNPNGITITVKKMYENEVKSLNDSMYIIAQYGVAFRDRDRVTIKVSDDKSRIIKTYLDEPREF